MSQTYTPSTIPDNVIRQFIVPLADNATEGQLDEHMEEFPTSWSTLGQFIFGGGMWMIEQDDEFLEDWREHMKNIYEKEFKPFLDKQKIDHVDMYIHMRDQLGCSLCPEDEGKEIVMAHTLANLLDKFAEDVTALKKRVAEWDGFSKVIFGGGIHKFQALWRGYNTRWENPFFTFED